MYVYFYNIYIKLLKCMYMHIFHWDMEYIQNVFKYLIY